MSDIVVRVQNLGKRYDVSARASSAQPSLREVLTGLLVGPVKRLRSVTQRVHTAYTQGEGRNLERDTRTRHFWALRGVSFDVKRGEVLGLIGPNGAGKSTLLKILSRITEPTEGRVEIRGRVASLLEVGTGFHQELSGRENIYLSGALLGMRKADIDRNLDEIIDFSGIEKFVDTPVKYYSSGMYVRLAFAVAAHLDPDILIVDEVLAVGDVAFQRKCLAKMEDVSQHGRTILFVSHNMPAVTRLCQRALLIDGGVVQKEGPVGQVASAYLLASLKTGAQCSWPDRGTAPGDHVARLRSLRIRAAEGSSTEVADIRQPIGIELVYDVLTPSHIFIPYCEVFNESGLCVFLAQDLDPVWRDRPRPIGTFTSTAWIPGNLLSEGALLIGVALLSPEGTRRHFYVRNSIAFQVVESPDRDAARGDLSGPLAGVVRPLLSWTTEYRTLADSSYRSPASDPFSPTPRDVPIDG